jgi:hypothetical protein
LSTHSLVIALTTAASLSAEDRIANQASILDRVINPEDWDGNGRAELVEAPQSIAWAIHLLSGAALMYADKSKTAFAMARSSVHVEGKRTMIVERHSMTGWPEALGASDKAWAFILDLRLNWPWLDTVFGDKSSYRAMLTAYALALNVTEFSERLRRGELPTSYNHHSVDLWTPLRFLGEDALVQQRAFHAVADQADALRSLFPDHATRQAAIASWPHWLSFCAQAARAENMTGAGDKLARYADLLQSALAER